MSEPSDIESCNEKTIIEKVIEQIDEIVKISDFSLWSYLKETKQYNVPVIYYLYVLKFFYMAMMSALVYYSLIITILKRIDENKSYIDTLFIIVPIYYNYGITAINSYLIKIDSIAKNLEILKHFLNTNIKIKENVKEDDCIKKLIELFLNDVIEFKKEINSWYVAYKITIFDPPKCHPLLEDITSFKDDLKYALDKDEKRNPSI